MKKVVVKVETTEDENGWPAPKCLTWKNGVRYWVDRVLYYARAVDGEYDGIRYTINIKGEEVFLYHDNGEWYVFSRG